MKSYRIQVLIFLFTYLFIFPAHAAHSLSEYLDPLPASEEFSEIEALSDDFLESVNSASMLPRPATKSDIDYDRAIKFYVESTVYENPYITASDFQDALNVSIPLWEIPIIVNSSVAVVGIDYIDEWALSYIAFEPLADSYWSMSTEPLPSDSHCVLFGGNPQFRASTLVTVKNGVPTHVLPIDTLLTDKQMFNSNDMSPLIPFETFVVSLQDTFNEPIPGAAGGADLTLISPYLSVGILIFLSSIAILLIQKQYHV